MEEPVVITQLDSAVMAWIAQEAERTGQPVEFVARRLIYRGLEVESQGATRHEHYHDLDALAGTWSIEEVTISFLAMIDTSKRSTACWSAQRQLISC